MKRHYRISGHNICGTFKRTSPDDVEITACDDTTTFHVNRSGRRVTVGNQEHSFNTMAARSKDKIFVWLDGRVFELQEFEETDAPDNRNVSDDIRAPMPGMIIKLNVAVGDEVKADQIVAVLEAMKMEHNLRAPRNGKVAAVNVNVGQTVSADAPLVHLESE
jgi:biotin carboxyl carrier protein